MNAGPDLQWVTEVLWGSPEVEVSTGRRQSTGRRTVDEFAVLPSAARPRLLVPLNAPRAAGQALRQYTTSKRTVRLATFVLSLILRLPLARRLLRHRVLVGVDEQVPRSVLPKILLEAHLREVLRNHDVEMSIVFNAGRPQKKPVLRLMNSDGRILAYVKIGWNELTRSLVRHEAATIRELNESDRPPEEFSIPRVLYAGLWRDLELLVVEPHPVKRWYQRRKLLTEPPLGATREVAALRGVDSESFGSSTYWRRLEERVGLMLAQGVAEPVARDVKELSNRLEELYGTASVRLGLIHGDWLPWNMSDLDGRLFVWDWERSETRAPLGLDAIHFLFQVEINLWKKPPRSSVESTLARSRNVLEALMLPVELVPLLLSLHLIEMTLRLEEGRFGGVGGVITNDRYHHSMKALLEEWPQFVPARLAKAPAGGSV